MEKSPTNTEQSRMSDVAMAREYVAAIGGDSRIKVMLANAFDKMSRLFPHNDNPRNQWTERRVRALWNGEAASVLYREMVELHRAAEQAKAEQKLLAEARKQHAEFVAKTACLRALLEHQDEAFHSPQIDGLGRSMGGVDRPGNEG